MQEWRREGYRNIEGGKEGRGEERREIRVFGDEETAIY